MAKVDAALKKRNHEALSEVAPLFDQLNAAWEKIEDFFRSQGILAPTYISYAPLECWHNSVEPETVGELVLGIEKIKGKWRICHSAYDYRQGEVGTWTPVSDCSTELRTELLDHVGKLFEKLVESNEKYVPEVQKAVAKSAAVLKELGITK